MNMTRKVKREAMREYNPFKDVLKVLKHYFPDLITLISLMDDPRNQSYITYAQEEFIMMSMFSMFTHMKSRRHMNECFNNETLIHNFKILFDEDLEEVPHGDTIHNYFKNVSIEQMRQILYGMFKDSLQKKIIDNCRIEDEYYHLVIDGVNMHSYSTKHVEGCSKDVCEYYETAKQGKDIIKHEKARGKEKRKYEYYNGIKYKEREMNIVELVVNDKETFCYITDIEINEKNYEEIIEKGRERWKIENKGFNDLKNHGYEMKHALSYDENAMKANFIIMMISQLVMQLLEHYERTKGCFETIRKLGEDIKEALRNAILSAQDIREIATGFYISRLTPY